MSINTEFSFQLEMHLHKYVFCSTLLEFDNFLLCEQILINVTTCQNEMSS
jgi:hypothetical protein